jgi:iron complex outermembrane receptor protein
MGPNGALFGFNAVGGVINIITYDPLYDDVNTASVTGGTQGLVQGSGIATFRLGDKAGLRISLGGYQGDDFSTPQNALDIGARHGNDRKAIDVVGHAQLSGGIDVRAEASHSEANGAVVTPFYTQFYVQVRTNALQGTVAADTGIGILQATAYVNWFKAISASPNPAAPTPRINNKVSVVQLRDVFRLGNDHTFRLSAEYRYNELDTTPFVGGNVHYDVLSGGGMWSWALEPGMTLTNALRVDALSLGRTGTIPAGFGLTNADWNNRSITEISFNSGLMWEPGRGNAIRLTAARGVQLPNLLDLGGLLFQTPFGFTGGNPTLKPSIVMNYELDWTHDLPDWAARLQVRVFHQTTKDIVTNFGLLKLPPPPSGLIATPINIGGSEATGGEISLKGTFAGNWRWSLSYTPEVVTDHFAPGFAVLTTLVDYQHTHPVHIVNASLGWSKGSWEIDGYLRYQSVFDSIQGSRAMLPIGTLVRVPDYVSVDARIAYRITDNLTLALSGQNLLQSQQTQTSAAAVERRVLVTASVGF